MRKHSGNRKGSVRMEIYNAGTKLNNNGSVVALGNFDGLHVAHIKIIRRGIEYAKENDMKSGVLLFEEHTTMMTHTKDISLITPNEAKLELLKRENPDFVYIRKFTEDFMKLSPDEFVRLLVDNLNIKAVCVGYDYRFGCKASGDVDTLRKLGKKYDFKVFVTEAVKIDGEIVSSTAVRRMIRNGDMEKAELFLGRRFCVEGRVVRGFQNGRRMGIPTANVDYDVRMTLPKNGVYAGVTYVDGKRYKSVVNVGKNPTFAGKKITIESHILDFDEDIYDKYIRVSFAKMIRGDRKFNSPDELAEQIKKDIQTTKGMKL